jgi:nitrogen regulatory protein P-II 1
VPHYRAIRGAAGFGGAANLCCTCEGRLIRDKAHIGVDGKGCCVKMIIAAIKPYKLDEVREALTEIGVRGMMVTEIKGFGTQSGHTEIYRGAEYAVNFVPKMRLEIVVSDAMADAVVEAISKTARTGKIGDGKIFVIDVQSALRVRTGETDDDAL